MSANEILKREATARAAIARDFGAEEGDSDTKLFASHHLEELDGDFWQRHLGTRNPEPVRILDILELRSHRGDDDDDGIKVFDFTLPNDVTNYVISVRFDATGEVEEISMES